MRTRTATTSALIAVAGALTLAAAITPQRAAADTDSYTVCSDIPWPPFEMGGEGDKAFGFDIDVMRAIAAIKGYDVTITNLAFDSIIPAVRADKCDIGASGFTITSDRDEVVDFTEPYYVSNQAVVTRSDEDDVNVISAMAGMGPEGAVGAQRGTTGAAWIESNLVEKDVDVEMKLYETYPLAIRDLVNGRIDAVVQDVPASKSSVASYPDELTVAGVINTYEYFGFVVPDGDPDGLGGKISDGLGELGLNVVDSAAGRELSVQPGTPWDKLNAAYFGPDNETITAAWEACRDGILDAESMEDVEEYAQCMADETD